MTHEQFHEIACKLIVHMVRTSTSLGLDGDKSHLDAIDRLVGVEVGRGKSASGTRFGVGDHRAGYRSSLGLQHHPRSVRARAIRIKRDRHHGICFTSSVGRPKISEID